VRDILAAHRSCLLATAGGAGPWVSGGYFAEDGLFTLSVLEKIPEVAPFLGAPIVAVRLRLADPAR
jgi:hypothetical protein